MAGINGWDGPTPSRIEIVNECRKYLGVPFVHLGRDMNGIDCVGLIFAAAINLGVAEHMKGRGVDFDATTFKNYTRRPTGPHLFTYLQDLMVLTPKELAAPADVLFLADNNWIHVGMKTNHGIIHSYALRPGKVVEHGISPEWQERIKAVFTWPWMRKRPETLG